MTDELGVDWVGDTRASQDEEEMMWSHEVLNQFELLIDTLGIETVFFLLSKEHEDVINNWVKNKVDIQHRSKQ